jgi:hypothetical protein
LLRGCKGAEATERTDDVEVWRGFTEIADASVVVDTLSIVG